MMMKRRFQSTGFGSDRDPKTLPAWKQKMLDSMKSKARQHREKLLQRLHQEKKSNTHLSPNSKKKSANQTIDSFKRALVEHEMKECQFQFTNSNSPTPQIQIGGNPNGNPNGKGQYEPQQDFDAETANLSPAEYERVFAELAGYLEDSELSGLRAEIASFEELEKDAEEAVLEEIVASDAVNDPHVVYCPLCCKGELEIEYMNPRQPVYGCLCGAKFRPRDCNVSNRMETKDEDEDDIDLVQSQQNGGASSKESDLDHAHRMLRSLKQNMGSLMGYHSQQMGCNEQLQFAVVEQTGYLQAWCTRCGCNEIVI